MKRMDRPEGERCYDPACHRELGHDVAPDWSKGPEYDEPGLTSVGRAGLPTPNADDIADEVEARLDTEQHERLCACLRWPAGCATYGTTFPWTHSDVHRIVEVTLQVTKEASA